MNTSRRHFVRLLGALVLASGIFMARPVFTQDDDEDEPEPEPGPPPSQSPSPVEPSEPSEPVEPPEEATPSENEGTGGGSIVDSATGSGMGIGGLPEQATSDPGQYSGSPIGGVALGQSDNEASSSLSSSSDLDVDATGIDRMTEQAVSSSGQDDYISKSNSIFDVSASFGGSYSAETLGVGVLAQTSPELDASSITGFVGEVAGVWTSWSFEGTPRESAWPNQAGFFIGDNGGNLDFLIGTDWSKPEPNVELGFLANGNEMSVMINGPAIFDRLSDMVGEVIQNLDRNIRQLYGFQSY